MADYTQRRALLISSSRIYGGEYLDHAEAAIRDLLEQGTQVLFIPYALYDRDAYATLACGRLGQMGFPTESLHRMSDPRQAMREAKAVFVGGGNTFRLLKTIYDLGLLELLRQRTREGMPYIGASAGTNLACPTIRTTNDMPIVEPPSLNALGLVGFQINPHYIDPEPASTHMGETREQRLQEYLEENSVPVISLREPSMLLVQGPRILLKGESRALVFSRGEAIREVYPETQLDDLLAP